MRAGDGREAVDADFGITTLMDAREDERRWACFAAKPALDGETGPPMAEAFPIEERLEGDGGMALALDWRARYDLS